MTNVEAVRADLQKVCDDLNLIKDGIHIHASNALNNVSSIFRLENGRWAVDEQTLQTHADGIPDDYTQVLNSNN